MTIILDGEWTMQHVGELRKLLQEKGAHCLALAPRPSALEIDMAGVIDMDACGCQLLALFLEKLKGAGISPIPAAIPAGILERVALLGFQGVVAPGVTGGPGA